VCDFGERARAPGPNLERRRIIVAQDAGPRAVVDPVADCVHSRRIERCGLERRCGAGDARPLARPGDLADEPIHLAQVGLDVPVPREHAFLLVC